LHLSKRNHSHLFLLVLRVCINCQCSCENAEGFRHVAGALDALFPNEWRKHFQEHPSTTCVFPSVPLNHCAARSHSARLQ